MKYIDTHSHLNSKDFEEDCFSIIEECLLNEIGMINVGTDFLDSLLAVEIAKRYSNSVYATVGMHPLYVEAEKFDYDKFKEIAKHKKVLAIGEIGLDYFYHPKKLKKEEYRKIQKEVFEKQLDLAEELNLPVVIHIRNAFEDAFEILKRKKVKGVIHCFTGNMKNLEDLLSLDFYIGYNGIIFKADLNEQILKTPNNKILIETDCPYLTPPNFYEKRNNPLGVKDVLLRINEIKGEDLSSQFLKNTKDLFSI